MGYIIDDKNFINENIFKFEKRLESQYTVFTEKNPTFVTYYHINNINSITDTGLLNVDRILGKESPLKYQKIEDFPIYGIDQIKLDLSDEEEGLNSNYEGDGIILPNTVHPYPNDFFTISYLDESYLFRITAIDYDSIKSNNYYKISFDLKSIDEGAIVKLNDQVLEKYHCIFKNIGTQDNCLIQEDAYTLIKELDDTYSSIVKKYVKLYYNKRYNSFIFNNINNIIYDKFVSNFIDEHNLLNEKEKYQTISITNEDYGEQFPITYDMSFYTKLNERNIEDLDYIRYELCPITYQHSIFLYYNLRNVRSLVFVPDHVGSGLYIKDELIDAIKTNSISEDFNVIENLIIKYFNDSIESIFQLDIDSIKAYKMQYSMNDYIMIPILLYILRYYTSKFLHM